MPKVSFQEILPHRAADLYALVMEIERYPAIFKDIAAVKVRHTGPNLRDVDVTVKTPVMDFGYGCNVRGAPPGQIDIEATRGMFKAMQAQWRFEPQPDGRTMVRYDMAFDFGGMGFMNAAAATLIEGQVHKTRQHLKEYAAARLPPHDAVPSPRPAAMPPPAP